MSLSNSEKPWLRLSSRTIHETKWLRLREDMVELPDGTRTTYGVVVTGPCVGVLPFVDRETVVLVRQYRYVAGRFTWEMPTGGVHDGEAIEAAALRELREETGYSAASLRPVSTYHTSKGIMDETAHLFVGEQLAVAPLAPDDTEFLSARAFPFREVLRMVLEGEITDSMTMIAMLHEARARGA